MNAGGRDFARRSTAARATAERSGPSFAATSSRSTLPPALASWAAIPPPITPEPMTATRLIAPWFTTVLPSTPASGSELASPFEPALN